MPALKYALAVYYIVVPAEVASTSPAMMVSVMVIARIAPKNLGEVFGLSRNGGFSCQKTNAVL